MFDLMILENQLKNALENKSFEKRVSEKKNLSRNKYLPKNKIKRTHRVWVEKGTAHSKNTCITTCFYCMKKGHTSNKYNIKHYDVPNEKDLKIKTIRSDHGREFQNSHLKIFVMKMEFCITSPHLGHLNKMEL